MPHIMFSYNWDHQELVLEVCSVLKSKGADIWVDVQGSSCLDKMVGSTDEMMIKATTPRSTFVTMSNAAWSFTLASSQAVNLSSHVVVFVTKKYLVSANCNQEVMRGTMGAFPFFANVATTKLG